MFYEEFPKYIYKEKNENCAIIFLTAANIAITHALQLINDFLVYNLW